MVAFFPSDHYISDDVKFMAQIRTALDTAASRGDQNMLLGLDPESPEIEYGWIEPSHAIRGHAHICGVRRFWEKPSRMLAQVLQLRGCLWNSFVMVASVKALLEIIESAIPELYRSFLDTVEYLGSQAKYSAIENLYSRLSEVNFSHRVLALKPERLAVLNSRTG